MMTTLQPVLLRRRSNYMMQQQQILMRRRYFGEQQRLQQQHALMIICVAVLMTLLIIIPPPTTILVLAQNHSSSSSFSRRLQTSCPPKGFDALKNFNLTSYVSARWYVIKQKPLIYSSEETFCSYAQYTINKDDDKYDPWYFCLFSNCQDDILISVTNRGLIGSVSGRPNIAKISARCPNPKKESSKIQVSFPIPGRTNYWIVAAGTYIEATSGTYNGQPKVNDNYEWAIISGGSPNVLTKRNKCVAGRFGRFDVRG
jgi:hypothetical protein